MPDFVSYSCSIGEHWRCTRGWQLERGSLSSASCAPLCSCSCGHSPENDIQKFLREAEAQYPYVTPKNYWDFPG